jgi:hypothetical protein
MPDRSSVRRWGVGLVVAGGMIAVVAMFGPWVRSGSNYRNSFEVVDLVDRLGFTPDGPIETAFRFWPVAPLAVVVAVVLTIWLRGRAGPILAIVVGLTIGLVGVAMRTIPESSLIGTGRGSILAALGGATMVSGGVTTLMSRRISTAPQTSPLEHVAEQLRPVGHDAVDAEVEQPSHLLVVVDRPDVDRYTPGMGVTDERRRDEVDPPAPC